MDSELLSQGQASCLVLGLEPTDENRKRAKQTMEEIGMSATYIRGSNPQVPTAIGSNVKRLNPFLYQSYAPTPPTSREASPVIILEEGNMNKVV